MGRRRKLKSGPDSGVRGHLPGPLFSSFLDLLPRERNAIVRLLTAHQYVMRRLQAPQPRRVAVFVACSTLCFGKYPLERTLRTIAELEFGKVEVAIREQGPHLRPSDVAADVTLAAQCIRIGPSLSPAAFNLEFDAPDPAEFTKQLKALCRLARMSAVTLFTLPAAPA